MYPDADPGGAKYKDPADPNQDADPEHWYKVIKKSQTKRNLGFSYFFCLMMEGSGAIWMKIR
jgi:hypothetical protein